MDPTADGAKAYAGHSTLSPWQPRLNQCQNPSKNWPSTAKNRWEKYIQLGTDSGKLNTSVPLIEVPIVDIGLLKSPLTRTEELHKLRSALSSWGCFQVTNHGMTSSFLEEMRQVAKQFFSLPTEEKQKYSRKTGSMEGYGNDMVLLEHQMLDWTDRLYLTLNPENQRQLRFWPENPQTFR
ncbi:hypothetical protein JCGZ_18205 [Jatropha curcas]|uniref:Non-haem dioxygenase N-terminal domain-containing protein n=1 Tax=Jatropha curcas TaxID=180498 RepID=A0A067K558_JATCU|nr:hypothetical protein JCGZ_18205 [Jatropha curcas]